MSRPVIAPKPGVRKQLPLKLPPDVEIDLHIFCDLHYGASRTRVIAEALALFIAQKLATDPVLDAEFVSAKAEFLQSYAKGRPLRIVDGNVAPNRSEVNTGTDDK